MRESRIALSPSRIQEKDGHRRDMARTSGKELVDEEDVIDVASSVRSSIVGSLRRACFFFAASTHQSTVLALGLSYQESARKYAVCCVCVYI